MASAFSIRGLSFTYREGTGPALDSISLEIRHGRRTAVMGRSGAGKTTLLYALAAVIPDRIKGTISGERFLFGRTLAGLGPSDVAGKVAMVFQDFEASLFATVVRDEVAIGPEYLELPPKETAARVAGCLRLCGLDGFEGRRVDSLSGGEKQRLAVAAALATGAEILLFDEATTDLDPKGKRDLSAVSADLVKKGRTVVSVEGETEPSLSADELVLLAGGRIITRGEPADVLTDAGTCAAAGVPAMPFLSLCEVEDGTWRLKPDASPDDSAYREVTRVREPVKGPTVLEISDLTYSYRDGPEALKSVNLTVKASEFVAIIGQNGSGKTTLAKCAAGILVPPAGSIKLFGREIKKLPQIEKARLIGYLFQNPDHQIFSETVFDEVAFGLKNRGLSGPELGRRVSGALETVGMTGREEEDPFALTKGERQRVALASVLAMEPSVIILDEPTTGLDFEEVRSVMNLLLELNRRGRTVVVITHSMELVAEYARRTVVTRDGRIELDGPTREVMTAVAGPTDLHIEAPLVTKVTAAAGRPCLTAREFYKVFGKKAV